MPALGAQLEEARIQVKTYVKGQKNSSALFNDIFIPEAVGVNSRLYYWYDALPHYEGGIIVGFGEWVHHIKFHFAFSYDSLNETLTDFIIVANVGFQCGCEFIAPFSNSQTTNWWANGRIWLCCLFRAVVGAVSSSAAGGVAAPMGTWVVGPW